MKNGKKWLDPELLILRIILLLVVSGGALFAIRSTGAASEPQIGPYTEIRLPLEDLPALPEDRVYNPVIALTSGEQIYPPRYYPDGPFPVDYSLDDLAAGVAHSKEYDLDYDLSQSDPFLQVLYVFNDPREVPLARYAYNSADGVVLPAADMKLLAGHSLKTINVYVKTQNFSSQPMPDPLFTSELADPNWPALYVSPLNVELEGISRYPCAAVEYADGTVPYQLPAGIDGGGGVGEGGLYDPVAYAPPRPWYYSQESALQPGEAREGWVSCLAPDVTIEQLQVKAKHRYMGEPEVVTFDLYKPGVFFPDHEILASIGLTLADLPGDINLCDEQDYCARNCSEAADLGVEQGVCVLRSENNGDITSYYGFRINEYTEQAQRSFLAWAYTSANSFPVSVVKLEDVPLTFYTDYFQLSRGAPFKTYGTVTFYDPRIEYSIVTEADAGHDESGQNFKHAGEPWVSILAQVKIEPYGVTAEDLQGYRIVDIGASVNSFFERDGALHSTGASTYRLNIEHGIDLDSGSINGVLYGSLGAGNEITTKEDAISPLLPNLALINIYSSYEVAPFSDLRPGIYPVNVVTMYQPDSAFVSKTEMCEVVECIDYIDEWDTYHHDAQDDHVPKPSRSVPVMCAGEWANNVIIDGINNISQLEYIGKPWGLVSDYSRYFEQFSFFFYDLRIIGGATPWWNIINRGRFEDLFGDKVDINTGNTTTYLKVSIGGYFSLVDKGDLSKGYFVPSGFDYDYRGWMGEIINQKVLAYSLVDKSHTANDVGFLFIQEGPIWTTSCQRDLLPVPSDQELYAPQEVSLNINAEEEPHDISSLLPGMRYPTSLPFVDGKVFSMGEYGDTYPENSLRFTVLGVETLPGKPDIPIVYVPGDGKFYPADREVSRNNEVFFHNNNAFVIPPDTTFVRIKIGVDRVGSGVGDDVRCWIDYKNIQLISPGYLPITGSPEITFHYEGNNTICQGEDMSVWISYMFPSLDFDLENMMISIHSVFDEQRPWNFWRLVKE